jgi:hypothetical protein
LPSYDYKKEKKSKDKKSKKKKSKNSKETELSSLFLKTDYDS